MACKYGEVKQRYEVSLNGRWKRHNANARKRGLENTLSFEEFEKITSSACSYCGGWSKMFEGIFFCGIDRIDNSIGYVWSNCAPACKECNLSRGSRTIQEFLDHCKRVAHK